MAVIGSLVVDLKADVARFSADLGKARGDLARVGTSVSSVNRQMETFGRTLRSGLGALGITVGIRELARLVTGALDAAGGLAELAEQMGITTRTLQVLQFAAVQGGVEVGELESGIRRFSQSIGEAAEGNKTYIDTFNRLGVMLLDAGGNLRSTEVVLREVMDALAGIEDPAVRVALAVELFGRGGAKLLPIINEGAAGFDRMAAAAEAAGAMLSDDAVAAAKAASDEIKKLELVITRWWQGLVISGIPAVEEFINGVQAQFIVLGFIADDVEDFAKRVIAALDSISLARVANDITGGILDGLAATAEALGGENSKAITDALKQALRVAEVNQSVAEEIGAVIGGGTVIELSGPTKGAPFGGLPSMLPSGTSVGVSNPLADVLGGGSGRNPAADAIKDLRFELEQLGRTAREQEIFSALEKAGVSMGSAVGAQIAALVEQIHKTKLGQDAANESFQRGLEIATAEDEARAAASERAKAIIAEREAMFGSFGREIEDREKLLEAVKQSAEAYELEARFQEIANQARDQGLPLYGDEVDQVRALVAQMRELDKQVEGIQALREEAQKFGETLSEDIAGGLADVISGTKTWEEVLLQLFETIAREIGKILEMESQKSGDGGGIGGAFGGLVEWFLGLWDDAPTGGSGTDFFPGFASGTASASPGWHMVGERGPEMLRFHGGEQVIPNHALGGGDTEVNVTVVNNTGQAAEVRRSNAGRDIEVMIGRAVAADAESNGPGIRGIARALGATRTPTVSR